MGLVAVAGAAVHFWVSRRQASRHAAVLHTSAVELATCVLGQGPGQPGRLTEQLDLGLSLRQAGARPWAECEPRARELWAAAQRQSQIAYHRSPDDVRAVREIARRARELAYDRTTEELRSGTPPVWKPVAEDLEHMLALACSVARAEGVFSPGPCPVSRSRHSPLGAPKPRVVIDVDLQGPPSEVVWDAHVDAGKLVYVTLATKTARSQRAWLLVSSDTGGSWAQLSLSDADHAHADDQHQPVAKPAELPRDARADQALLSPDVVALPGGRLLALFAQRDPTGGWGARVTEIVPGVDAEATAIEGLRAAPLRGTALLPVEDVTYLAQSDGSLVPLGQPDVRRTGPSDEWAVSWMGRRAHLVTRRRADSGFVELAQYTLPAEGKPWPEPVVTQISHTPSLELESDGKICGPVGERFYGLLGRAPKGGVLTAFGEEHVYPYRFSTPANADLSLVCGPCVPAALERDAGRLRILVPVRRKLVGTDVALPVVVDAEAVRTAVASCTTDGFAVAYVARQRVLAQRTDDAGWRFGQARVVAEPTRLGVPEEVRAAGAGKRLVLLWRRRTPNPRRLRIEAALSDDGGVTWH